MSLAKRCLGAFSMGDDRRRGEVACAGRKIDGGRQGHKVWRCEDGDLIGWRSRIAETEHGNGDQKQRCSV